jgi:uncharacterized Zn-binding protein involved in type VI secretion
MAAVARIGDEVNTGHACDTVTTILSGSTNVLVEGVGVARSTDPLSPHTILAGTVCVPHPGTVVNKGSSTVFVNGLSIARVGDSADLGNITFGAGTVFAG